MEDANRNLVTGYTGTVYFTSLDMPAANRERSASCFAEGIVARIHKPESTETDQ